MEVKKEAIFRVQINDLRIKKSRVITVYSNKDNPTLEEFKVKIVDCIKCDK